MITSSVTFPEGAAKYPRAHTWRPQQLLSQPTVFAQQLPRCSPVDPIHHLANGQLRGNRPKQVNMIFEDVAFYDFDIQGLITQAI